VGTPPLGARALSGSMARMLQDLAALAAPIIVCVAFLVGAGALVRRELAPRRRAAADRSSRAVPAATKGPADGETGR